MIIGGLRTPSPFFQTDCTDRSLSSPVERLLFPDLHLFCHHHSHEHQRSGRGYHGEGLFPPALQGGLARVSPTSDTRTQLTLAHACRPLPSLQGRWDGIGMPSHGTQPHTVSHLTHKPWMALPTEQDLCMQGIAWRPGGFWGEDPGNLHFAEGKETETSPPRCAEGIARTLTPAVKPTAPGFFPT